MKRNKLFTAAAATLFFISAMGMSVSYAENKSTTITLTINDVESDYTLTIPSKTTIADFGYTELSGGLKVEGTLSKKEHINVSISSDNGYKLVDTADNTKFIAYSVKNSKDNEENISECDFYSEDLGVEKKLGVYVTQEDWNAAPPSDYSDVLVFTANTVKNEEEGLK